MREERRGGGSAYKVVEVAWEVACDSEENVDEEVPSNSEANDDRERRGDVSTGRASGG